MKKYIILAALFFISLPITGQNNFFADHSELEVYGQKVFSEFPAQIRRTGFYIPDNYVLGVEDELLINIWGAVEEEHRKTIEYDGAIFIPKIGKIHLEGKRLNEARELIKTRIFSIYKNVSVSVTTGKLRTLEIFVLGEVKKPGNYIISPMTNILEVLAMAGGITEKGSLRYIRVTRKTEKTVNSYDLYPLFMSGQPPPEIQFFQGDMVFVPLAESFAGIKGAVRRPGIYEITYPATLKNLINLSGGTLPNADFSRIQVERIDETKGKIFIDVTHATYEKFVIKNFDIIHIFPLPEQPFYKISLEGAVKRPGTYGWKEGLRLSDVLKKEELLPYALMSKAEIIRTEPDGGKKIIIISPEKVIAKIDEDNLALFPQDRIIIYSQERPEKKVVIQGQVYHPGEYVVVRGERLSDLVRRAGGFTRYAYLPGIVFTREEIRAEKEKQVASFIKEKETMLKQEEQLLERDEDKQLLEQGKIFIERLKGMDVKGRIPLHINDENSYIGTDYDIGLENGDIIYIPDRPISVAVLGEVNLPANIIFREDYKFLDYIQKSGGFTKNADRKNIFIVKANGTASKNLHEIKHGDTIVVPLEIKERKGRIIKDIVQMFYHISLGVAAY
jgi:polysaccharide biosynthesis/export protein